MERLDIFCDGSYVDTINSCECIIRRRKGEAVTAKGMLLVMMQPAPALEGAFNAWYDTEHIPERLAVPGIETARRYVCLDGWPRYLALYDLATLGVLDTPAYCAVAGGNFSPWTQRTLSDVRVLRNTGTQIHPGDALTTNAPRLTLLRFSGLDGNAGGTLIEGLRANYADRPALAQLRLLACATDAGTDYFGLIELRVPDSQPIDAAAFGRCAARLDLVNSYARY